MVADAQQGDWVARSNENAQLLIDISTELSPEGAARLGVTGHDEEITILSADLPERQRGLEREALAEFQRRLEAETDPLVKQDLEILIAETERSIRSSEVSERLELTYINVPGMLYAGVSSLLDDQIEESRRPAALIRLRRYLGLEEGYESAAQMAMARFGESLEGPEGRLRIGPPVERVEQDLSDLDTYINGIALLFEKYGIDGAPLVELREQMEGFGEFVETQVLPRTRTDFRLPPELYELNLESVGIDYPIEELQAMAHRRFDEWQAEMQTVANRIAAERGLESSDYRDVIRELKKAQLNGEEILPHYEARLKQIEDIIRRENLITLPERPAIIRLASAAETAQQPAPHMRPPRLLNNHGERGEFVLPLVTGDAEGDQLRYDDFTFEAASWTILAHEARPGHELQFDAMVEQGVSLARANYAFNSTNVEGWALYTEWVMLPYMSDEGKLISLQLRMLRAARAFLDPELQQGVVTAEQAREVLRNDVVLSEAFADEEVDRYTFRSPGQAVSYFDGYLRLRELRDTVEAALGDKFNLRAFHDFLLSQGLLPPSMLRDAVMQDFVAAQQ